MNHRHNGQREFYIHMQCTHSEQGSFGVAYTTHITILKTGIERKAGGVEVSNTAVVVSAAAARRV